MSKEATNAKVSNGRVAIGDMVLSQMETDNAEWRAARVTRIVRNGAETWIYMDDGRSDVGYAMKVAA